MIRSTASIDIDCFVNNIGSVGVGVDVDVTVIDMVTVDFVCSIFILDRLEVAYVNSFSELTISALLE